MDEREDRSVVLAPVVSWVPLVGVSWALVMLAVVGRAGLTGRLDGWLVAVLATLGAAGLALVLGRVPRVTMHLLGEELVLENAWVGRQHLAYGAIEEVTLEEPEAGGWLPSRGGAWRLRFAMRSRQSWTLAMWSWWGRDELGARARALVSELQARVGETQPGCLEGEVVELVEPMTIPVGVSGEAVSRVFVVVAGAAMGIPVFGGMAGPGSPWRLAFVGGWLAVMGLVAWQGRHELRGVACLGDGELRLPGHRAAIALAIITDVRVVEPFVRPGKARGRDPRLGLALHVASGRQWRVMYASPAGREALRRRLDEAARRIAAAARGARVRRRSSERGVDGSPVRIRWVDPQLLVTVMAVMALPLVLVCCRVPMAVPVALASAVLAVVLAAVLVGLPWLLRGRRPRLRGWLHVGVDGVLGCDGFVAFVDLRDIERVDVSGRVGLDSETLSLTVMGDETFLMALRVQGLFGRRVTEQLRQAATEIERRAAVARRAGVAWLEPPEGPAFEQVRWLYRIGAGVGAPYRAGKVSAPELWGVVRGIGVTARMRVAAAIALSRMARGDVSERARVAEVIVSRETREAIMMALDGDPGEQTRVWEGLR